MDGTRFDTIARRLSLVGSRRDSVKAVATAGLGLGLASLGLAGADAGKKKNKKKKRCKRLLQTCNPDGKRKCCDDLICSDRGSGFKCRKGFGDPCENGDECAGILFCLSGTCDIIDIPLP